MTTLDDYTLSRSSHPSLDFTNVPSKKFVQWPDTSGQGGSNGEQFSDLFSGVLGQPTMISLGFKFPFCGVEYTRVAATPAGIAILIDPTYVSPNAPPNDNRFEMNDDIYDNASEIRYNSRFKSTFAKHHVLLSVWSDQMTTICSSWEQMLNDNIGTGSTLSAADAHSIRHGLIRTNNNTLWNESNYAVRYTRTQTPLGNAFVIRWDVVSGLYAVGATYTFDLIRLSFEAVLYENGTIQFKYPKRINSNQRATPYRPPYSTADGFSGGTVGATIGVFANWTGWNFRDFSPGLGYRDQERTLHANGGSSYSVGYTDTGVNVNNDNGIVPYTCNLDPVNHWPAGSRTFTVFTFAPPSPAVIKRNRSILRERDALSFATGGMFDDQKTTIFGTGVVEYPSMLYTGYRQIGNSENPLSVNRLFKSGSIQVSRSVKPGLFEDVFHDAIIEEKNRGDK